jgi:uncharacterized protein YfaS (alpha-2-macroglobulin family)
MRRHRALVRTASFLLIALVAAGGAVWPAGAAPAAPPAAAATSPGIVALSPKGTVKQVRQIAARFATPMVPYGDPRSPSDPLLVTCPVAGTARWVDARSWVYDFVTTLPGGMTCTIRQRPDLADLAGKPLPRSPEVTFSTGGPAVESTTPSEGEEIDAEQAFLLRLDAGPTAESVEQHASFAIDGIAEKVGVRIVDGDERAQILARWDVDAKSAATALVLAAKRRFPDEATVRLIWGAGITTATGVATTQDQTFQYTVRAAFSAEMRCERENARAGCIPLTPIVLRFSAQVPWAAASQVQLTSPDGKSYAATKPDVPEQSVGQLRFPGPFPESATLQLDVPADLKDDAGRTLVNAAELAPMRIAIAADPPLAKFASRFAIVELKADPALPVTIRSLGTNVGTKELRIGASTDADAAAPPSSVGGNVLHLPATRAGDILAWLRKVNAAGRETSIFRGVAKGDDVRAVTLPELSGQQFQVVGIPLPKPGLYVVEIASQRLGEALLEKKKPLYVPAAALVTDMAVHFEWAKSGSLVWVTHLSNAEPVDGAEVAIHDCGGALLWKGVTDAQGIARIAALPDRTEVATCRSQSEIYDDPYHDFQATRALSDLTNGLFVTAVKDDDLSFVHSSWDLGIEPFRFDLPAESWGGPYVAHAVLDRALLRAGETLHLKNLFRVQTLDGFAVASAAERPQRLSIRHTGSDTRYDLPLTWLADGSAAVDWPIPKEAKLGLYEIYYLRPGSRQTGDAPKPTATPAAPYASLGGATESYDREWLAGSFRVAEFRVPLARGVVELPAVPQVAPSAVPVTLAVKYLAGGAAADLPVMLRSQLEDDSISPPERDGFSFGNGAVKTGLEREGENEGCEGECEGQDEVGADAASDGGSAATGVPQGGIVARQQLKLDQAGTVAASIANLPPITTPRKLRAELEFRDPNGEVQTAVASVPLWPADVVAGIEAKVAATRARRVVANVVVLNPKLAPAPGVDVVVEAFARKSYTVRKRIVGGFYAYEFVTDTQPLGVLCRGRTRRDGTFHCARLSKADGNVLLQVTARDAQGRASIAHQDVWIADGSDQWFEATADDRMDVLADKKRYEPGETAKLQVRMPFRDATALVTVAREGVVDARVVKLSGKNPMVDVPVTDAFSPNMFVSVLALRGRVGDVQPTARVDLGKPSFRLGVVEIKAGWRPHELDVQVATDRDVYRVRETAHAKIAVKTAAGAAPPAGSTIALAAVDEGLLELAPNTSWELLKAMMGQRPFGVWTSTGQMEVIGKRHYGLKARPQGGGGGRSTTRELFDTLLLWRADVALDGNGTAEVDIPLNDSLTSFRVVAVATGGTGLFGTGETSIRSTQDLMLFSGLPPVVRTGDQLAAEFTLRNTTDKAMTVALSAEVAGLGAALPAQTITLAPSQSEIARWPVTVPASAGDLRYTVSAQADGGISDRMAITQRVTPAVPVRVLQGTLVQIAPDAPYRETVAMPAGALAGQGGIEVRLAPSILSGLDGVRTTMTDYPYTCLEQRVSRAVALDDPALWTAVLAALPAHLDDAGLLKFFPTMREGDELLSAYVLTMAALTGHALPDEIRDKVTGALRGFVDGTLTRSRDASRRVVDLPLRKMAVLSALATAGALDPALVESVPIEPNLWPASTLLDWWTVLARTPKVAKRDQRLTELQQIVRARLELGGTTIGFRTSTAGSGWSIFTGRDVDALRLVLLALDAPTWRGDSPRMVKSAMGLQRRGAWDTTIANAWGTLATRAFVKAFEGEKVSGETRATLADAKAALDWAKDPKGGALSLSWPASSTALSVEQAGTGRPWANVTARAAVPLTEPLVAGYRIVKQVTPVEPRADGTIHAGDVLRVRLEIDAQADMPWVVVDDPVPAGSSQLRGLPVGTSVAPVPTPAQSTGVSPAFVERSFQSYKAYFEDLPAGKTVVEYAIRVNQSGRFLLPPTRVAALYAPETFGEIPNAAVDVVQ